MEGVVFLAKIIAAILTGAISYWWWRKKRYRAKADEFRELLLSALSSYEAEETTLSAAVLSHYPEHNDAFEKLLIYVPPRRRDSLRAQWKKYTEIYAFFNAAGIFGVVMAELPHPDFEPNVENVDAVSRKRKRQISGVLREFIDRL